MGNPRACGREPALTDPKWPGCDGSGLFGDSAYNVL